MKPIRKAIIPAAGFGTRFLPATKSLPKEMLPIVDKPVIQYIVEEGCASGVDEFILITGANKRAIEDHFDYNFELEHQLKAAGKTDLYNEVRAISDMAKFVYVRQKEALGNGHAVLCAKTVIAPDEPFIVLWGDDFIDANPPRVKQLVDVHSRYKCSVLSVIRTDNPEDTLRYGYVDGYEVEPGLFKVNKIVEKPGPDKAPSNLAVVSGFALNPEIMHVLETLPPGQGGEIWLMDAVNALLKEQAVYALEIKNGRYYDCGNKLEYLKANIDFGLRRPDLAPGLLDYLRNILAEETSAMRADR